MTKLSLSPEGRARRAAALNPPPGRTSFAATVKAEPTPTITREAIVAPACPSVRPEAIPEPPRRSTSELLAILAAKWPDLFVWERPKPLAIGIAKPLRLAAGFSWSETKRALVVWTGRRPYHEAVASGSLRYDLEGTTTYITAEQTAHALKKLNESPMP